MWEIFSQAPTTCRFNVSDTGPGIGAHELTAIFDPFTQTRSGKKAQKGTGLGLYISQKFVRIMGGEIKVRSDTGRGACFFFHIRVPVVDPVMLPPRKKARRIIALAPGQPLYRILIVDDNRNNRKLLLKLLEPFGFELREAENGLQAVSVWEEWRPHLIWMDIRMPVLDGHGATRKIKASVSGESTVIIAVTAGTFGEDRQRILAEGCRDILLKPFKENEVFDLMQRHLGLRYVYGPDEDAFDGEPGPSGGKPVTNETLATLPPDLIDRLKQSLILGDLKRIYQLIEEIRLHDDGAADDIQKLVEKFEYGKILKAIGEIE